MHVSTIGSSDSRVSNDALISMTGSSVSAVTQGMSVHVVLYLIVQP